MRSRFLLGLALSLSFTCSALAGPFVNLFKVGGKEAAEEFGQRLTKFGVSEASNGKLIVGLRLAVEGLGGPEGLKTSDRLAPAIRERVVTLMGKEMGDLNQAEVAFLTNTLSDAARGSRVGRMLVACQRCVDADLAKIGILRLASEQTEEVAKEVLEMGTGAALNSNLIKYARTAGLNGLNSGTLSGLAEEEKQLLALSIKKGVEGTAEQKAFFTEIKRFNTDAGGNGYARNKFFVMLAPDEGFTAVDMERHAKVLKQLNDANPPMTYEQKVRAYNKFFDNAADTPALKEKLAEMRSRKGVYNGKACNGCYCVN